MLPVVFPPVEGTQTFPTVRTDLNEEQVLKKCDYFAKAGLWPLHQAGFDPKSWLDNFQEDETEHAIYLLNSFLYFSDPVIRQIFRSTVQSLSSFLAYEIDESRSVDWSDFLNELIITPVVSERPAPSDSGSIFSRLARREIPIPKERILTNDEAIQRAVRHPESWIMFVDDFVGSGQQFLTTYEQKHQMGADEISFEDLATNGFENFFYCPIAATMYGTDEIVREHPEVILRPGHILPDQYSVFHPGSVIWPDHLIGDAERVLFQASQRAGIPDDPTAEDHWKGFHELGLALSFSHGTPDATIPLIWWENNGWTPLRTRG